MHDDGVAWGEEHSLQEGFRHHLSDRSISRNESALRFPELPANGIANTRINQVPRFRDDATNADGRATRRAQRLMKSEEGVGYFRHALVIEQKLRGLRGGSMRQGPVAQPVDDRK